MATLAKKRFRLKPHHWFVLLGLTPIIAVYTYLRFIPIVKTFYISLFQWDMVSVDKPFVGMENFVTLFQSDPFLTALKNTTIIAFGILIFSVPIALIIAYLLSKGIRFKSWYEAIYFLPYITPMVPVAVTWKWILDSQQGLFNYALSFFGISPKPWLLDPTLAIVSVIMLTVWKTIGYNMIIFTVGLTGISKEYYEAASIDGATGLKAFRYITIPLLKPITVFVSVITLIHGYNVFSQIYVLASDIQGSPGYVVRVLVYDMIENAFRFFNMGYASAEAVVLFLIVLILTGIQMGLAREKNSSGRRMKR
ncbi:sugar ABC transporter permease [Paenibacillus sp. 1011MAR3C5]|uniref:carbohydrate ABC transporter permease n=1 Tax=Paenibacillus sp. 1011MAR3C5 TaxID=1675787 RepID=UPI000E6BA931|nr:sugar ABC transporter permease [Paenibacillus sp. 1011MAR3C5]RJE90912.1 sugar ABC transporter permease [Paenibacillus sp. 1011MAR3C5]